MKFALLSILLCRLSASAAGADVKFSSKLGWEKTADAALEFPHPEGLAVAFGMAGFEDSLMFRGADNSSLVISLIDEIAAGKSLKKEVAEFEGDMRGPGSKCTKSRPGEGKLKNGWPAAWTNFSCENKDGKPMAASIVVFSAGGRLYSITALKTPPALAVAMAGKGRLRK